MSVAPIRYGAIRQDMWRGRVVATLSWLLYRLICASHTYTHMISYAIACTFNGNYGTCMAALYAYLYV